MAATPTSATSFLAGLPADRRAIAKGVHAVIRANAPTLKTWVWSGPMWGGTHQTILGYGEYQHTNTKGETSRWFQIGLANQKNYVSLYVNAARGRSYLGQLYAKRLGKVKTGAASISFNSLDDVDLDVLAEMVREVVELGPPQVDPRPTRRSPR